MEQRVFQRPETVRIEAEITDLAGELYSPTSVVITIRKPDNTVILNGGTMTEDDTGKYSYDWNTTLEEAVGVPLNPAGWYKYRVYAVDGIAPGDKRVVVLGGFQLQ